MKATKLVWRNGNQFCYAEQPGIVDHRQSKSKHDELGYWTPAASYKAQQAAVAAVKEALTTITLWRGCYESIKTDDGIKQFRKDVLQAEKVLAQLRALDGKDGE